MTPRPGLFLDRDGVINYDYGYVHRPEQCTFISGIFDLARFVARDLGWPIMVVTNQAGIGRGYYSEAEYLSFTEWMCRIFADHGAPIARVYHCPFHPTEALARYRIDHPWRKPRPGMILQAAKDCDIDLPRSVLIGDKMTDMEAAAAAGISLRLLLDDSGEVTSPTSRGHLRVQSLADAERAIRLFAEVSVE